MIKMNSYGSLTTVMKMTTLELEDVQDTDMVLARFQ